MSRDDELRAARDEIWGILLRYPELSVIAGVDLDFRQPDRPGMVVVRNTAERVLIFGNLVYPSEWHPDDYPVIYVTDEGAPVVTAGDYTGIPYHRKPGDE
jgi:hypothetical protein